MTPKDLFTPVSSHEGLSPLRLGRFFYLSGIVPTYNTFLHAVLGHPKHNIIYTCWRVHGLEVGHNVLQNVGRLILEYIARKKVQYFVC